MSFPRRKSKDLLELETLFLRKLKLVMIWKNMKMKRMVQKSWKKYHKKKVLCLLLITKTIIVKLFGSK